MHLGQFPQQLLNWRGGRKRMAGSSVCCFEEAVKVGLHTVREKEK